MSLRFVNVLLVVILCLLQFRLWAGESSAAELWRLSQAIEQQQQENVRLKERNRLLDAAVRDLRVGLEVIEDRARRELGLVHRHETFFQIIDK